MESPDHDVTPEELQITIQVWLKTMPKHLWRPYEEMLAIDPKRRKPDERVDPRKIVAAYLAECFERAGWSVSHPQRGNIFSGVASAPVSEEAGSGHRCAR